MVSWVRTVKRPKYRCVQVDPDFEKSSCHAATGDRHGKASQATPPREIWKGPNQQVPSHPTIQIIPTLGPNVCKYYLHWAIWIPRQFRLAGKRLLCATIGSRSSLPSDGDPNTQMQTSNWRLGLGTIREGLSQADQQRNTLQ